MLFRQLNDKELPSWYEKELCTTFIPQECTPLEEILRLKSHGRYELWGLFDGSSLLGYAALRTNPGTPLVLLDFLGVSKCLRNKGLGSKILQLLKEQGRPLLLESEETLPAGDPQENALRERRLGFYSRNGFVPVYRMAACGMAFHAFLYPPSSYPLSMIMKGHRLIYGESRTDVCVPLPIGQIPPIPYWVKEAPRC